MLKRETTWYRGTFLERLAIGTLFCVICKISFETSILNVKTTAFQAKLSSNGPLCLTCIKELHWHRNKPFPSSPGPLYQNEVKCSAFDMEVIFHSHANKTHVHKKGSALGLILKVRVFRICLGWLSPSAEIQTTNQSSKQTNKDKK